jgi:hypothetical protein
MAVKTEAKIYEDEKIVKQLSSLYSRFYKSDSAFQTTLKRSFDASVGPEVVTNTIVHAIRSKYPKIRYQVVYAYGMHTTVLIWLSWVLPASMFDKML